ncbi:uncharacterized protein LOC126612093 isoform X2 [Malus sylvestris]|uniref:uncharacterized protein LOC126612093 isoform X2 n=1 Tax=Malus sylvestris TaxID=3752 RepID=UPI0021AC87D4|nr:uncharacterized protein LOC126612093 isoform X2 [Malus sylvestris]
MKFYTSSVDTVNRNINFVTDMFAFGTLKQYVFWIPEFMAPEVCEEGNEEDEEGSSKTQLGPQCTLKEQIEKDMDDGDLESLRGMEQLLMTLNLDLSTIPCKETEIQGCKS